MHGNSYIVKNLISRRTHNPKISTGLCVGKMMKIKYLGKQATKVSIPKERTHTTE